jgi:hypothetical protein
MPTFRFNTYSRRAKVASMIGRVSKLARRPADKNLLYRLISASSLLPLLLVLLPVAIVQAQFNYTANNGTITITGYTGPGGAVVIPSRIHGLPVTAIGDNAFLSSSLTSVTIPDTVTTIGYQAFCVCSEMTNAIVGNGVTTIGDWAFAGCHNRRAICFLGNAPSFIGGHNFMDTGATTVYYLPWSTGWSPPFGYPPTAPWDPPLPYTHTTNNHGTITVTGYTGSGGAAPIPSTIHGLPVTAIGSNAFFQCRSVTNITIPGGVTSIGDTAFYGCSGLASVTIPNTVGTIGTGAFYGCSSLPNVTIPTSVTTIGQCAFDMCSSLTVVYFTGSAPSLGRDAFSDSPATVYYLPGITGWDTTFGGRPTMPLPYAYETNNGTITITRYTGPGGAVPIPDTIYGLPVTTIGNDAFLGCLSVTNVTIPTGVTSIGDSAFAGCSSLVSVSIPYGVTNIGAGAFALCYSLAGATIPDSVTTIGDFAFFDCTTLAGVTIPDSLTAIGKFAFSYCASLVDVTIPDSITDIGQGAFMYCTNLIGFRFQGNAPTVGSSVFSSDNSATVYYLPETTGWGPTFGGAPTALFPYTYTANNGTIAIRRYYGPGGDVAIPDTILGLPVTIIGGSAFQDCTSLTSVAIPNSVTSIGARAFMSCTGLTGVTIGSSVIDIGDFAFWGTGLKNLTIPDSVTSFGGAFCNCSMTNVTIGRGVTTIGVQAFWECPSLASVTIPDSVTSIGNEAFYNCRSLASITIPNGVPSIGDQTFQFCYGLTNVTIGNSVTNIGRQAFTDCTSLTSVTIPDAVTTIGSDAFYACTNLTQITLGKGITTIGPEAFGCMAAFPPLYGALPVQMNVCFTGNAPTNIDAHAFDVGVHTVGGDGWSSCLVTVYSKPGTTGWGLTLAGRPVWNAQIEPYLLGLFEHGTKFQLIVRGNANMANFNVVVEACTNLANPAWSRLQTNTLHQAGTPNQFGTHAWAFIDPTCTNHPIRLYRIQAEHVKWP